MSVPSGPRLVPPLTAPRFPSTFEVSHLLVPPRITVFTPRVYPFLIFLFLASRSSVAMTCPDFTIDGLGFAATGLTVARRHAPSSATPTLASATLAPHIFACFSSCVHSRGRSFAGAFIPSCDLTVPFWSPFSMPATPNVLWQSTENRT
jgi:hypothetical protein